MTAPRPPRPWATAGCLVLLAAGAALLWLPFHTQRALDAWAIELRAEGVPARATVEDRVSKRGGTSRTMHVRYELAGRTHQQEIACFEVCRPPGDELPIWVNRDDPTDFVTDFGQLSGHRGRFQGGLGAAGFGILVVAVPLMLSRIPRRPPRRKPRRVVPAGAAGGYTGRSKHKPGRRR